MQASAVDSHNLCCHVLHTSVAAHGFPALLLTQWIRELAGDGQRGERDRHTIFEAIACLAHQDLVDEDDEDAGAHVSSPCCYVQHKLTIQGLHGHFHALPRP